MGPMGPMMGGGGWTSGVLPWEFLVLFAAVVIALGFVAHALWYGSGRQLAPDRRRPEEILRERYARGELTQAQYREALADVLKDRYVRGEIDVEDYETRLGHLLGGQPTRRHDEAVSRAGEARAAGSNATKGG